MKVDELQNLIAHCVDQGGLTLSDLSRWLQIPLPTVREWAYYGRNPRKYRIEEVIHRLYKLKELVENNPKGVIPYGTAQQHRSKYIVELRNATLGILKESAAS